MAATFCVSRGKRTALSVKQSCRKNANFFDLFGTQMCCNFIYSLFLFTVYGVPAVLRTMTANLRHKHDFPQCPSLYTAQTPLCTSTTEKYIKNRRQAAWFILQDFSTDIAQFFNPWGAPSEARQISCVNCANSGSRKRGIWPNNSWQMSGSGVYPGCDAWRMYMVAWRTLPTRDFLFDWWEGGKKRRVVRNQENKVG